MSENNEEVLEYILEVLERMSDSYLTNESPTLKGALQVGSYSIVYNIRPKQDELHGYEIEYVPTFIFYREDKEIGRIIETPILSLEEDMLAILIN